MKLKNCSTYAMLLFLLTAGAWAQGPEDGEKRLWEETGETGHGTITPQFGPAVPLEDLEFGDDEAREQIERHQRRLREKVRKQVPPLKHTVPVEDATKHLFSPATEADFGTETSSAKASGDFVLLQNTTPSAVAPTGFSSIVNEPAVAAVNDTVFYTGNWYSALSTDGGDTFSYVNAFAGPFPKPSATEDFCCDQVVTYDPTHNSIIYVQQFFPTATRGVQRINVDTGADGNFDCFYDVTPAIMGMGGSTWPDFPDLAVSDNYLYQSTNVYSTVSGAFVGAYVVRLPLAGLAACTSLPFDVYRDFSGFFSFKLSRGATDRMYFADHISNASLRIWRWREVDSAPVAFDRAVSSWTEATRSCPGPDARDWCGRIDRRIAAAWVADGILGFMWVPAQGGAFTYPYTRIARFLEATFFLVSEPFIWSPSLAWAYPSVAVNRNGDLGGTILFGGGSFFPSCAAWIADDANGDALAPLEHSLVIAGTTGPASNVSGDYLSTEPFYPTNLLWAGACFAYESTSSGTSRYVKFGREGNVPFFTDGFESGDVSSWSRSVP